MSDKPKTGSEKEIADTTAVRPATNEHWQVTGDGYQCAYCIFVTPHKRNIRNHVTKSHGAELEPDLPPPPVQAPRRGK